MPGTRTNCLVTARSYAVCLKQNSFYGLLWQDDLPAGSRLGTDILPGVAMSRTPADRLHGADDPAGGRQHERQAREVVTEGQHAVGVSVPRTVWRDVQAAHLRLPQTPRG